METSPIKLGEQILHTAGNVGSFVLARLRGGAFGEVAEDLHITPRPQAHIDYHTTPSNVIRSEE